KKSLVRTTELPGQIAPLESTPLVPKVAGYVKEIKKDIGDAIEAGKPLVVLTAPELDDEVRQKQSAVDAATSGIAQAEAGVTVAKATLTKAEAVRNELAAGVLRAKADVER